MTSEVEAPSRKRLQFSIASLLLWVAVGALAVTLFTTRRELSSVLRELESTRPIPARDVVRQFEAGTNLGPITTNVRDVRYSPEKDIYRVEYQWVDATKGEPHVSSIELKSDGFGTYYGQIPWDTFYLPLGHTQPFGVRVKAPSPLAEP